MLGVVVQFMVRLNFKVKGANILFLPIILLNKMVTIFKT